MQRFDLEDRVPVIGQVARHRARQEIHAKRRGSRDAHFANIRGPQVLGHMAQLLNMVVDIGNEAEQPVCLRRGYELASHALEKVVAKLLFGVGQDLADRRLRHVQEPGGIGHRTARIYGVENLNLA